MKLSFRKAIVAKSLVLVVLLALTASTAILGRRVGKGQLDPVLAELIEPMHARGIDVVAGDTSAVRLSNRPRIARLAGMPKNPPADVTHIPWKDDFLRGRMGFVAGAKTAGPRPVVTTKDQFLVHWEKAPVDKRVFLSFTSADVKVAHKAAQALQDQGYVTFVFLNPGKTTPTYDAERTGKMFSQAGHHIVLDTKNARKSHGVWLEASLARGDTDGRPDPPRSGPPKKPSSPSTGNPSGSRNGEFDKRAFTDGVTNRWVVTRNPEIPNKLFVHRSSSGGMLEDLLYNIKVESNGTWTVYEPGGGGSFGTRVGSVRRPSGVSIGRCTCQ